VADQEAEAVPVVAGAGVEAAAELQERAQQGLPVPRRWSILMKQFCLPPLPAPALIKFVYGHRNPAAASHKLSHSL